ncbi:MAG: FkbM family methyltransferase, partial [Rhodospirillales bacterium]
MKQFMFRTINRLGNSLSYRQSRFILNTLGLSKVIGLLARDQYSELALPNGIAVTINPLLHASMEKEGRLNYESDVLEAVERRLGAGGVFYDVGANVGVFSFIAAAIVGEGGRVLAFEPEENNLVCFRRSLDRSNLKNISLYDLALGCEDGRMTFDRSGGAFSGHLAGSDEEAGGEAVMVEVRAIDSLVDSGAAPPTLLKIDVEGGEGAVLEGARKTLG